MFKNIKFRLALIAAGILLAALALAFALLSARTFYPELIFSRVQDAFMKAGGYELNVSSLEGNPITGVSGQDAVVTHGGETIAAASRVRMRLSFRSLLTGKPKLASLTLSDLDATYETILEHLPETKIDAPSEAPAVDRVILDAANLHTQWGSAVIARGSVRIGEGRYTLSARGAFREKPMTVRGSYNKEDNGEARVDGVVEWAGQKADVKGVLSPDLSVNCDFTNLNAEVMSELFSFIDKAGLSGVYSGKVTATKPDKLAVRGEVESPGGKVWRLPFEGLAMKLDYDGSRVRLSDASAKLFGGEAAGDADIILRAGASPRLALRFEARELDTKKMVPEFGFLEQFPAVVRYASMDISGPVTALEGPVYAEIPSLAIGDIAISELSGRADLRGGQALFVSFAGRWLDSALTGSGDIGLSAPNRVAMDAHISPLSLASLSKQFPDVAKQQPSGVGVASARIEGPADNLSYRGNVAFPKLSVQNSYHLSNVSAEFAYTKESLALERGRALWNGAEITAEGVSNIDASSKTRKLDFAGKLSRLDLASLGAIAPAVKENDVRGVVSGNWALRGDTKAPAADFSLTIPSLSAGSLAAVTDVSMEGRVTPPEILFSKINMRLGRGSLAGGGTVTLAQERSPLAYEIKGLFQDIDPTDIQGLRDALPASINMSGSLNGDARVWSGADGKPQASAFLHKSGLAMHHADMAELTGGVEFTGEDFRVANVVAKFGLGYLHVDGWIRNVMRRKGAEGGGPTLDLRLDAASVDIGQLSRVFSPAAHGYQGLVVASADVSGFASDPSFKAAGSIVGVRAFGLFLPRVRFTNVSGGKNAVNLPTVDAIVGRGRIEASGGLSRGEESWSGSLKAKGRSVDIRSLTFSLDDETRRAIKGTLDFDFEGGGSIGSLEGRGTLYVPYLEAMGLKLTKIRAPFVVTEGFFMIEESTAKAYTGDVAMQMAANLSARRWGGRAEVTSADLGKALPDVMPDMGGMITGKTDFKLRFGGDSRRTSMQDAEGSFEVTNGEISGFRGAAAVSKIIGGRPLRFKSALGSFNIDGKTLYLLPGSRVAAPKGDPVFKYIMIDGSLAMADKSVALACVGNVNVRALNTFAGAVQGLMTAAIDNKETLLQDFLGGAISGLSRNEFRDVSLRVKGAPGSMRFENVVVSRPQKVDLMPEGLADPTNSKEKDPEKIRINLEFPVGPGSSGSGQNGDAAGQVGGQVLEQAIKGILSF